MGDWGSQDFEDHIVSCASHCNEMHAGYLNCKELGQMPASANFEELKILIIVFFLILIGLLQTTLWIQIRCLI